MKRIVIILSFIVAISLNAQKHIDAPFIQDFTENLELDKYITDWQLLGPIPLDKERVELDHLGGFEKDYLSEIGGENNSKLTTEKAIEVGNQKLKWIDFSGSDQIISLDEVVSKESNVCAYAFKEIYSKDEGMFVLALGTNDGGRLWVNGEQIWDYREARGCIPDSDLVPVYFKKGRNQILLKIEEKGNSWEFCARIMPFEVDEHIQKGELFSVVSSGKTSSLKFALNETVINKFFESVGLEIYTKDKNPSLVWKGDWNKKKSMLLNIESSKYNLYQLKIAVERKDGKKHSKNLEFYSGVKETYSLFKNQESDYKIVLSKEASKSEQWAARELKNCFEEIGGIDIEIVDDAYGLVENEIIIGYNQHAKKVLGNSFKAPELLDESFIYKNIGSKIVLLGGKQRGTMYAVFSFLENEFGVRWYTPSVTTIPKRSKYSFSYLNHFEEPTLQVRNDFYYEAFDATWAAHSRINGAMGVREQPGEVEGYWAVHTFYRLMPPTEFFDSHPEYYSLIDGKRIHERAQLCLTNSNVVDIITDRLRVVMRANPGNLIYSISQNDWKNPCECDNCRAIVEKEGSEAGIMVWFVNQVADKVKEEFPDKYVGTLAYQYTRKPPVHIKPKENVVIRLCSIECCFSHKFKSCPVNQEFLNDLEEWSSISPHLYIWDYVVNFSHYLMPYPNFSVLQPNIKTFIENSSIGIMAQAAYQSRGGELAEVRAYLIAKLLWNSDVNVTDIIDDFMIGYYGRSGKYIHEYLNLVQNQVTSESHIYFNLVPYESLFTNSFIDRADALFDKAEIVAESDEIKKRIELTRLSLMYLKLKRNPLNSKYDGTFERFNEIVEREHVTHFAEAGKPHKEAFIKSVSASK